MPDSRQPWFGRLLPLWGGVYCLLVLLFTMTAMYTLSVSVWRGPWRDMWEAFPFIEKALAGQAGLWDYWDQYGYSHRPLLSRWFWVADLRWFAGSNYLLLAVSVAMQLLSYCAIRAVLQRDASFTPAQRRIVLAGVLFCLFNIAQVFNFLHTFDVQWFLVAGFVVLSLERILANRERHDPCLLAVAWLSVFIASLNNFSALVIWPVEILLLLALRFPLAQVAGFTTATVLYLVLYFHELPTGGGSILGALLSQPLSAKMEALLGILVVFPLWYLSNPLSFQLSADGPLKLTGPVTALAPTLAAVLMLGAAWCWWQGLRGKRQYSSLAWLGLVLVLYGYGVGVVTALGRAVFWENVYALRYQNIVLLFWIGIVLWLAASVRHRYSGLFAGACLLLLVYGMQVGWYHDLMLKTGNRTRDAHLALVVGLENHLSAIQATVSRSRLGEGSVYNLKHEAELLRQRQAGPYAEPAWQVLPLADLRGVPVCEDVVAGVTVHGGDESYARLAIDFARPVRYDVIAWFDADISQPGLLIAARADQLTERLQQTVNGFTAYAGFARAIPRQTPERIFARQGEQWCRLSVP